jgi:hypothetical protein
MTDASRRVPGLWGRFSRWIKDQLVGEVPVELAACEFECEKDQCLEGEWVNCQHRIDRIAKELMRESSNKDH